MDYSKEYILGIDEAGRGPVLGPMVYACCIWPVGHNEDKSVKAFVLIPRDPQKDSKTLTTEQREELYKILQNAQSAGELMFDVRVLTAEFLSSKMLQVFPTSLNVISHESAMDLIDSALAKGIKLAHVREGVMLTLLQVYVDTVGPPASYQAKLVAKFRSKSPSTQFTVEPKADSSYPVVSAASIVAKAIQGHQLLLLGDKRQMDRELGANDKGAARCAYRLRLSQRSYNKEVAGGECGAAVRISEHRPILLGNLQVNIRQIGSESGMVREVRDVFCREDDEEEQTVKLTNYVEKKPGDAAYYFARSIPISYAPVVQPVMLIHEYLGGTCCVIFLGYGTDANKSITDYFLVRTKGSCCVMWDMFGEMGYIGECATCTMLNCGCFG